MNAKIPASVAAVRADLLRDAIFEMLEPVEHDSAAARHCLSNADDVGARYHLKRVVECVKAAAATFRELEALTSDHSAASERAA
jgi:propanediol dehydratase small subunit